MPRVSKPVLGENSHDYKGSQQYHCKTCNRQGTLPAQCGCHQQTGSRMQHVLLERASLRGIERIIVWRLGGGRWRPGWQCGANTYRRWPYFEYGALG